MESQDRFLKLFSTRYGSKFRTAGSDSWRAVSKFHALSDAELIASVEADSTIYRVLSVDDREVFLVLQFEHVDREADSEVWSRLKHELLAIGISDLRLHQVSESAEYQVFISLAKPYSVASLVAKLRRYLDSKGLDMVRLLQPEDIFVLPLQPGYRWMNDRAQAVVARRELSLEMALEYFVSAVTKSNICPDELNAQLDTVLELCLDKVDKVDVQVAACPDKDVQEELIDGLDIQAEEPLQALRLVSVQADEPEPTEAEVITPWTPQIISMDCLDNVQEKSEDGPIGIVLGASQEEQAVQVEPAVGIDSVEARSFGALLLPPEMASTEIPAEEHVEADNLDVASAVSELEDQAHEGLAVEAQESVKSAPDDASAELPAVTEELPEETAVAVEEELPGSPQPVGNVIPIFQQLSFPFAEGLVRSAEAQPNPRPRRRSKRAPPPE